MIYENLTHFNNNLGKNNGGIQCSFSHGYQNSNAKPQWNFHQFLKQSANNSK